MAGRKGEDIVRCSFCNKTQAQVRKMIAGPNGAYICDECIEVCSEIIEEELGYEEETSQYHNLLRHTLLPKPQEIYRKYDKLQQFQHQ